MSDSDSDDFGPQPQNVEAECVVGVEKKRKRRRLGGVEIRPEEKRQREELALRSLPTTSRYETSFMHRSTVTSSFVSKRTDFVITASSDGHVKFWKKLPAQVEFVKHFHAHLEGGVCGGALSGDESRFVTISREDSFLKVFDVRGFDLSHLVPSPVEHPNFVTWCSTGHGNVERLAVCDGKSGKIFLVRADETGASEGEKQNSMGAGAEESTMCVSLHYAPVILMASHPHGHTMISCDAKGMMEYWSPTTGKSQMDPSIVSFQSKLDTDLYCHGKAKTRICSLEFSKCGEKFATLSTDRILRVFSFRTGKLLMLHDTSMDATLAMWEKASVRETMTEGPLMKKRIQVERELESNEELMKQCNAIFDETGDLVLYAAIDGIRMVSVLRGRVVRTIGSADALKERFLNISLYQGTPKVDRQFMLARGSSEQRTSDEIEAELNRADPTIFCTAKERRRFYCFTTREPTAHEDDKGLVDYSPRDRLNEAPTAEERAELKNEVFVAAESLPTRVVLHTTMGDVHLKLYSAETPRTVENFTTHVKNGYYDGLLFHRVIKGFMLQTGDPLGDGTGGESIWGGEFDDEFVRTLRHDRPFTLSMANAGPNTNGSQFFITTVPAPWLDNIHTVFGRVKSGFDIVTAIEKVPVDEDDRPLDSVKILSARIVDED